MCTVVLYQHFTCKPRSLTVELELTVGVVVFSRAQGCNRQPRTRLDQRERENGANDAEYLRYRKYWTDGRSSTAPILPCECMSVTASDMTH